MTCSASTNCSFQIVEPETPSPEPEVEEMTQPSRGDKNLGKSLDSYNQLTADNKKHNNSILACKSSLSKTSLYPNQRHINSSHVKTFTLVNLTAYICLMYIEIIFFKPTLVKTDSQVSFIFPLDILT